MQARPEIADLRPYQPGKPASALRRELGLERIVKLGSNEGPRGPFPAAMEALAKATPRLNRYPEGGAELLERLAARHGLTPDRVAAGNGADGVIANLALAYLRPGDEVLMGWPSFVSYRLSAVKMGATPVPVPLRDGSYDLDAMAAAVTAATRIAYVCSPNNPTGGIVSGDALAAFLDAVPERVLVVIDSAYHEYVTDPAHVDAIAAYAGRPNVVVLRTFSKIYGLAGLRIGYGVASAPVVAELGKVRGPFDVSELAQVAAVASLDDEPELKRRRDENEGERRRLEVRAGSAGREALSGRRQLRLRRGRGRGRAGRPPRARGRDRASARLVRRALLRARHRRAAGRERRLLDGPRQVATAGMSVRRDFDLPALRAGVLAGEKRAVARAITLVENRDELAYELVREIYPHTGGALVAGFTGPPGVGKSSLLSSLVTLLRSDQKTVGMVSVDPSSPFSHGAVLGDRIRLSDHFLDAGVFIRSMSTRGHLGGISEATLQALLVLDASGKDVLLLETVGVGQSEVDVATIADTVVLVLMPGSGDSVQALKAGVMEIPDVIVINKADHPAARTMRSEIRSILSLDRDRPWKPPIVETEAIRGEGVDQLWVAVLEHRAFLERDGGLEQRRRRSIEHEVVAVAVAQARRRLSQAVEGDAEVRRLLDRVHARELDPLTATREIAERVLKLGG